MSWKLKVEVNSNFPSKISLKTLGRKGYFSFRVLVDGIHSFFCSYTWYLKKYALKSEIVAQIYIKLGQKRDHLYELPYFAEWINWYLESLKGLVQGLGRKICKVCSINWSINKQTRMECKGASPNPWQPPGRCNVGNLEESVRECLWLHGEVRHSGLAQLDAE